MPESSLKELTLNRHPQYYSADLELYRLIYDRGPEFVQRYLRKHFEEDPKAFEDRKFITYCPHTRPKQSTNTFVRSCNAHLTFIEMAAIPTIKQ